MAGAAHRSEVQPGQRDAGLRVLLQRLATLSSQPAVTETQLAELAALLAPAVEDADAREPLERVGAEQAALRRVATLVAEGAEPADVFLVVSEEVDRLFPAGRSAVDRYEPDGGGLVVVGIAQPVEGVAVGSRWELDESMATTAVYRTGRSARIDAVDWSAVDAPIAGAARRIATVSTVASPIVVEGRLWGTVAVSASTLLPPDTEERLGSFTTLVATAIANGEARDELLRVADEQAALRRVATLVAKEATSAEVFAKVAEEAANVIGGVDCALCRDEGDGTITTLAAFGAGMLGTLRVGERFPVDGTGVVARVLGDGRPSRIDDYSTTMGTMAERGRRHGIRSAAGCPIVVGGRTWGAIAIARYDAVPIRAGAERRIAQFADLAATAIANAAARAEVERLLDEQAALRRVATLVAEGASPGAVFDAAAAALGALLHAHGISLCRYEPGDELTVVAHLGPEADTIPPGTRVRHDSTSVTAIVRRTERPARLDSYAETGGGIGELIGRLGFTAGVGAPIVVEGRLWGVTVANWTGDERPPPDTEQRMAAFTELLGTAIANADSHDQLIASRARLLTAGDDARRRVVRDLHDGAQQRLVSAVVALKLAQRAAREDDGELESLLAEALEETEQGTAELRDLAHGILPTAVTWGGLPAGVDAVVARLDLPIAVDVPAERLPAQIEANAYFIVTEALTNVIKHARADGAEIKASVDDGALRLEVRDDGVGGADPTGHGLVGLADRVNALGGRLSVESPVGRGTVVTATLPLPGP